MLSNLLLAAVGSFASPDLAVVDLSVAASHEVTVSVGDHGGHGRKRRSSLRKKFSRRFKKKWKKQRRTPATPVPEPLTMSLLGIGGAGVAYTMRRRRRQAQEILDK